MNLFKRKKPKTEDQVLESALQMITIVLQRGDYKDFQITVRQDIVYDSLLQTVIMKFNKDGSDRNNQITFAKHLKSPLDSQSTKQ